MKHNIKGGGGGLGACSPRQIGQKMLGSGSYLTAEAMAQPLMLLSCIVYYRAAVAITNCVGAIHYCQNIGGSSPCA